MKAMIDGRVTTTVKSLSRDAGISVSTVWKLIREGELETIAIYGRRLVLVDGYNALIERKRNEPQRDLRRIPKKAAAEAGTGAAA
jgi:hypothetical protein